MKPDRIGTFVCPILCAFAVFALTVESRADETIPPQTQKAPTTSAPVSKAQKIDVDALKQKYWAKGDERALEVVQNRTYTKAHRLIIEGMGGEVGGDPFQTTVAGGVLAGFYFNEYLGVDVLYMKMSSSHSAAYNAFVNAAGFGVNSNPLNSLMGGELTASLLYGKLSLVGKAILHFDLMARAGIGKLSLTGTQPAQIQTPTAPWIGVGQQLYLTHWLSLHLDWRMMFYSQNIVEQFQPDALGQVVGSSSVTANMITGGLSVMLF